MQFSKLQKMALATCLACMTGLIVNMSCPTAYAQSAVTGAISGTVTDWHRAVVPNATVTVLNIGTNGKITVPTNGEGHYTASQLPPGTYKVAATATGMQSQTLQVAVLVGTTIPGDIKVTPTGDKTVVEVSSTSLPLVDTRECCARHHVYRAADPGVTHPRRRRDHGGLYSARRGCQCWRLIRKLQRRGLPGISNLFVLNGFDNQDPFLNLNNSGSSNLTLGQGEWQEATVVMNGYNSQYGRAAGAIINYTTKSRNQRFPRHGRLQLQRHSAERQWLV